MGQTPRDFPIPDFDDDDTKRVITVHDFKPVARAARYLVAGEQVRRGQLSVLLWLVGVAVTGGGGFAAWLTTKVVELQSSVAAVAQHADDLERSDR
jgi:hypothetical protein